MCILWGEAWNQWLEMRKPTKQELEKFVNSECQLNVAGAILKAPNVMQLVKALNGMLSDLYAYQWEERLEPRYRKGEF